jgi:GNAT superfamily N-acetyltransferase
MHYQRERATAELFDELIPLLVDHYREIAHYPDLALDPDFDTYLRMDEMGFLRVFTARDSKGALYGYAVYFVRHNIHYKASLQAQQDILYVHPKHRGTGAKLIVWADNELRREGVQAVYHHVKAAHNFGTLLVRMGYQLVDLIYAKRLDK